MNVIDQSEHFRPEMIASTHTCLNNKHNTKGLFIHFHFVSGAFAGNARKFRTEFLQDFPTPGTGPYFDTTVSSNVTGLVGKTVHLICKVKNLGNRTVSKFEFHLSFGRTLFCLLASSSTFRASKSKRELRVTSHSSSFREEEVGII